MRKDVQKKPVMRIKIEGAMGVGKTTVLEVLQDHGYVLGEEEEFDGGTSVDVLVAPADPRGLRRVSR